MENHELAKEKLAECASWVAENPIEKTNFYHGSIAYTTIWNLYLYHKNLNQTEEASKYLTIAYATIGKEVIDKYHNHLEKNTHPEFFYCREIIKTYEASLHQ